MKRFFAILVALILAVLCFASAAAEENLTISFEAEAYSVPVGKSIALKTIITPKQNLKLEWSSSDEAVATVAKNGTVKGVSVGEAVITVKSVDNNEISASCKVSVVNPVKRITLTDKNVSIAVNTTWGLKATVEPEEATNKDLVWSSSNENVAMVNQKGVVTGLSKGNAKITVEAMDGSGVKTAINVRVDQYDLVFTSAAPQQATYYLSNGNIHISGGVKTGCVSIPDLNYDMFLMVVGAQGSEQVEVTPVKAGTDIITIKGGRVKTTISVYVSPDAFKVQNLGFGQGAVVETGKLGVFNGHTYQLIEEKCTWLEAKEKCEVAGGHLATITSTGEQQFLGMLNKDNKGLWMGLRKDDKENWQWITGEEFEYSHWADGEPNNYHLEEYPYENCGLMRPEWNDCHENNIGDIAGYICEWDSVTIDVEYKEDEGTVVELGKMGIFNDHTYQIFDEKCSWSEARKKCEAVGGYLATITSPDEQKFIEMLNTENRTIWIGLRRGDNDSWFWVTGEKVNYTHWANGEPNNYWLEEYPGENSVAIRPEWNDYHENNIADLSGYVCEWDSVLDAPVEIEKINSVDPERSEQQVVTADTETADAEGTGKQETALLDDNYHFLNLPWGITYNEAYDMLMDQGIEISAPNVAGYSLVLKTTLENAKIADKKADSIKLYFSTPNGKYDSTGKLYAVFCSYKSGGVKKWKDYLQSTYGEVSKDEQTEWVWEKGDSSIALLVKNNTVTLRYMCEGINK